MYVNHGHGQQGIDFWGLSPTDNNTQINNFKAQHGTTHPCAGTQGGGPAAINIVISGQPFLGYPTWVVVCPDRSFYFDICYPPNVTCFDQYFALCTPAMIAGFTADQTEICTGGQVQFTDQSTGNPTAWSWTFEGGTPGTSSLQNPLISYETPGLFDVSLTVSSGSANNSINSPEIITVNPLPDVTLMEFDTVCDYYEPFLLTGGMPEGGIYSGTGVENGIFYPSIAGVGTHEITYTYMDAATGCEESAVNTIEVDICSGILENGTAFFRIYPNPSKGELFVELSEQGNYLLQITNILGAVIYEQHLNESATLQLDGIEAGLYTVTISDGTTILTRKLSIRK